MNACAAARRGSPRRRTSLTIVTLTACALAACGGTSPAEITGRDAATTGDAGTQHAGRGRAVAALDARIWCLHEDSRGHRWFGSNGAGVFRHDGERLVQFTSADGLPGDAVRGIVEHADGTVLVATSDGVAAFDGEAFHELELTEPTSPDDGWRLDPDDVWLVVGPGVRGPCRYDGERVVALTLSESPAAVAHRVRYPDASFPPAGVYSIHVDRRGHVWFGTAGVGLCRYDGSSLAWMYEEHLTTTPSGGAFGIRSIHQDRDGAYWICNTRHRFADARPARTRDGHTVVEYTAEPGLPDAANDASPDFCYFSSVAEDGDGTLWFASGEQGVWSFDGERVERHPVGDGAYALALDLARDGTPWVGTLRQGAYRFDGARFVRFEP